MNTEIKTTSMDSENMWDYFKNIANQSMILGPDAATIATTTATVSIPDITNNIFTTTTTTGSTYPIDTTTTGSTYPIDNSYTINIGDLTMKAKGNVSSFYVKDKNEIINIIEYVPEKVYKIIFNDGTEIKTIREEDDPFDLEYMFYLALSKKLYSKTLTFEGVLWNATQLQYEKYYNKIVKRGVKLFNKLKEEKCKKEEEEKAKKRQHERYVRRKKATKERKKKEQINLIAEAIRLSKEEG